MVPSVSSSFVAIDEFQVMRGDSSETIRKHGCYAYVADFLSFVSVVAGVHNVAARFLPDLDIYVLVVCRPTSNPVLQDEHLLSLIRDFCIGRERGNIKRF